MFGKKILSVVGLIFLGSQIVSIEGQECKPTYNSSGEPACSAVNCGQNDNDKTFIATGIDDSEGNEYAVTVTYSDPAEGASCELKENFNGQDYCVDNNGFIYERTVGLCNAVVDAGNEDCKKYYNCNSGVCEVSTSNSDPNAGCVPAVGKKCGAGYYLVDSNELSIGSGQLWQCFGEESNCVSSHQIGFLVNAGSEAANTKYIQCDDVSGNCSIATIGDDCDGTGTGGKAAYGQLYTEDGTNYKLCLFDVEEKSITINESKKYLIEKKASILGFLQDAVESTKYVALEVDASKNIVPVASTAAGYYSTVSRNPYEVVTEPETAVTLYNCVGDGNGLKCGQVTTPMPIGYLKNQAGIGAPYIYCPKSGICDAIAVTGTSCVATAINEGDVTTGNLYSYSGNKFCVFNSGNQSIDLTTGTGTNEGMYFVSAATSLFQLSTKADGFIIVRLDGQGNLTVVKESTTPVRYRYTLGSDTKNKIHPRAQAKEETGTGQICNASGTPKEFTLIQWESSDIDNDKAYADYYIATPSP